MNDDAAITLLQVRARLGRREVLRGVSTEISRGSITAVAGPNGAGKSTLLRTAAGLVPPTSGRILVAGRPLHDWHSRELARHLAYVAQVPACHWPMPAREVVALGRGPHRSAWQGTTATDDAAVRRAMADFRIDHLASRGIDQVSGGELRRILLARAFAGEPQILVLDEPNDALDPGQAYDLFELLRRFAANGGTVFMSLHDLTLAARACDRLILLREGVVEADGAPSEALQPAVLAKVFGLDARLANVDGVPVLVSRGTVPLGSSPDDGPLGKTFS